MTKDKKQKSAKHLKNAFSTLICAILLLMLLKKPKVASDGALTSLKYCLNALIPSLFPLMIASELAIKSGALQKYASPLIQPISKLFGVSKAATLPYFVSLVGGYGSSASSTAALYKNGDISKRDCESIIALSSIPSPAFLIGFVGASLFKNTLYGWILWMIQIFSTLILGAVNSLINKEKSPKELFQNTSLYRSSFSKILISAITHSSSSIALICACVIFFSTVISSSEAILTPIFNDSTLLKLILGLLEITNGAKASQFIAPLPPRAAVCSAMLGWSGLCVHFQIMALCEDTDLSFRKYFILKLFQCLIAFSLSLIVFSFV
jgi:sporulation integral membrane protein YlbJ